MVDHDVPQICNITTQMGTGIAGYKLWWIPLLKKTEYLLKSHSVTWSFEG